MRRAGRYCKIRRCGRSVGRRTQSLHWPPVQLCCERSRLYRAHQRSVRTQSALPGTSAVPFGLRSVTVTDSPRQSDAAAYKTQNPDIGPDSDPPRPRFQCPRHRLTGRGLLTGPVATTQASLGSATSGWHSPHAHVFRVPCVGACVSVFLCVCVSVFGSVCVCCRCLWLKDPCH